MRELTGRLEAWNKEQVIKEEFIIWGFIYNDVNKRWGNGTWMHTSGIKNRKCEQGDVVDTRNSRYELGVPIENYTKVEKNEDNT